MKKRNRNIKEKIRKWWDKNRPSTFLAELKQYSRCQKIGILLSSLFFSVYSLLAFGIFEDISFYAGKSRFLNSVEFLIYGLIIFAAFIVFIYIHTLLLKLKINNKLRKPTTVQTLSIVLFSFAVIALLFASSYPLVATTDAVIQLNEARSGVYTNWHPAMHTFLFFKIPMSILGDNISAIGAVQSFVTALIIAYMGYSFCSFGIRPMAFYVMLGLMAGNIVFVNVLGHLLKDNPYSFGILLMTLSCMWIYYTDGQWLHKKHNIVLFVISGFLVLFMRHNGILSFVATFAVLIFAYKPFRKKLSIIFISLLAAYFIITGPIYSILGIAQHSESFAEKLGVPNNQIAYIVKNGGDVSEDEMEFIDQYISVESIERYYIDGDFNKVKWSQMENGEPSYCPEFLGNNKTEYFEVWFSLIKKNFGLAVEAYKYTTKPIWNAKSDLTDGFIYSEGLVFFLAAFSILIATIKNKRRFISFLPVLVNVLGVMLLITGGESRFIFSNLTTCIPLIVFAFIQIDSDSVKAYYADRKTEVVSA